MLLQKYNFFMTFPSFTSTYLVMKTLLSPSTPSTA